MNEIVALSPLLVLAGGVLLLMLQIALRRQPSLTRALSVCIYAGCLLSSIVAGGDKTLQVTPLLLADNLAFLLCATFAIAGAITAGISGETVSAQSDQTDEYYLLLTLATLGACVLAYANHAASLVLGLELLSVSLYALIAYPSRQQAPAEAATKYLVLSGAATATILFGFALLYAATGALGFADIGAGLTQHNSGPVLVQLAAAMVITGLAFKLAAAPLHIWTPDVYEGAPSPISGFLASVAKVAPFIVLLRFFVQADLFRYEALLEVTALLAVVSMLAGNLLALLQNSVKRMLAYSSIGHVGYVLIIFSAATVAKDQSFAIEAAVFYLIAYVPTTIAAFAVLTALNTQAETDEDLEIENLTGLFWRQPLLAFLMMVSMLSLAGIPLTAGFIGKLYIFYAAIAGAHWVLLAFLIIGTTLGIYYYLRVIYQMAMPYVQQPATTPKTRQQSETHPVAPSFATRVVFIVLLLAIFSLGVVPQALMHYLEGIF